MVSSILALVVGVMVVGEGPAPTWTLEDCIAMALSHNPTVQKAAAAVDAARGARTRSLAGILPTVSLYGDVSRYSSEQMSFYQDKWKTSRERYSAGLQLQQTLFDGGGSWASLASASARVRAAEGREVATRGSVAREVADLFSAVLRAEALLKVAEEAEQVSRRLLERAEAREGIGSASRQEVLRAKVQVHADTMERMRRANELASAKNALLLALGMSPGTQFHLAEPSPVDEPVPSLEECLADVAHHPSLLAAEENARAARRDVASASAMRYPSLTGTASYGWSDVTLPGSRKAFDEFDSWRVGLTVSVRLFDGLGTKGQIQTAKALAAEAAAAWTETRLSLQHAVQVEHQRLIEALAQVEVARLALDLANEEYRLAEERYTLGSLSFVDLGDSKLALERAKVSLVEATTAVRMARVALEAARGRLGVHP